LFVFCGVAVGVDVGVCVGYVCCYIDVGDTVGVVAVGGVVVTAWLVVVAMYADDVVSVVDVDVVWRCVCESLCCCCGWIYHC